MLQYAEKTGNFDNLEHRLKAAVATGQMSTDLDVIKRRLRLVDMTTFPKLIIFMTESKFGWCRGSQPTPFGGIEPPL